MNHPHRQTMRRMPIFGAVSEDMLDFIYDSAPTIIREPHDCFFSEGDAADAMYVIIKGSVLVEKSTDKGLLKLRYLNEGDCFGEMAILDLQPRSATVRAETPCMTIEITPTLLEKIYRKDVEQYALIHMNLARELSRRLRFADKQLVRVLHENRLLVSDISIYT